MFRVSLSYPALLALMFSIASASNVAAQKSKINGVNHDTTGVITLGQPLEKAIRVLQDRKIEFHENTLAVAASENSSHLTFTLDENSCSVAVWYSPEKRIVTGVTMIFFPHRTAQFKTNQSWVPAQRVAINEDGTYDVRFSKPPTPEEVRRREEEWRAKSALPPAR